MKLIFDISIVLKGKHEHKMLRKEVEIVTSMFPFPGIQIEDSAWREPKIPLSITCNFKEGYYHLYFGKVVLGTMGFCEQEVEMYRRHDWKDPAEWM